MKCRFFRLFSLSILIAFSIQIPVFLDLLRWMGSYPVIVLGSWINFPFIFRILAGGFYEPPRSLWRLYLTEFPFYIWWTASLLYTCIKVPILLAHLLFSPMTTMGEHAFLDLFSQSAFLWALTHAGYLVLWRRQNLCVNRVTVPISNLPEAYEGYRIVQMTDLHCSRFTPGSWIARWAEQVNALAPHLIVLTGDYISAGDLYIEELGEALSGLSAPDGVVAILGNHDYFGDTRRLILALERAGIKVLRNQGRILNPHKPPLFLAGVDDTWTRRADIKLALAERPKGVPTILLAHDPSLFPEAVENHVDLTLSGHTHGGQVAFPIAPKTLNLSRLYHRFVAGLYRIGSSTLYVSRGAGTTGPPVRLNVSGEISEITLTRG
ncbi:MAG TPA: metallophosphoesterase [Candidatus Limnocylindrales bacterium]|nr:metallophosphoesterase [Candidatus Limnocylindrales bacterium]